MSLSILETEAAFGKAFTVTNDTVSKRSYKQYGKSIATCNQMEVQINSLENPSNDISLLLHISSKRSA